MKTWIVRILAVPLVVAGIYGWAWRDSYRLTEQFYKQAEENFRREDYAAALKGGEMFDERAGRYVKIGGYEHILEIWSDPWAIPRPAMVEDARKKIGMIIHERLGPDEGMALFRQYFRLDNEHLPEILLASGRKYKERGQTGTAREAFLLAIRAFGNRPEIRKQAESELKSIGKERN